MQADPKGVLTGSHYLDGDHACSEGAIAAAKAKHGAVSLHGFLSAADTWTVS